MCTGTQLDNYTFYFFSLGDEWFRLRKSLAPAFHHLNNLSNFSKDMNNICDDFIELLKHERDQSTNIVSNLQDVVFRLSLEGTNFYTPFFSLTMAPRVTKKSSHNFRTNFYLRTIPRSTNAMVKIRLG